MLFLVSFLPKVPEFPLFAANSALSSTVLCTNADRNEEAIENISAASVQAAPETAIEKREPKNDLNRLQNSFEELIHKRYIEICHRSKLAEPGSMFFFSLLVFMPHGTHTHTHTKLQMHSTEVPV